MAYANILPIQSPQQQQAGPAPRGPGYNVNPGWNPQTPPTAFPPTPPRQQIGPDGRPIALPPKGNFGPVPITPTPPNPLIM